VAKNAVPSRPITLNNDLAAILISPHEDDRQLRQLALAVPAAFALMMIHAAAG
jgi:hypothetical protein